MNKDNDDKYSHIDYAESLGYTIRIKDIDEGRRILFDTSPNSPIGLRLDITSENNMENHFLWIYIRTTSWDFNGDRSDLHELISSIVSITLKGLKDISVSMLDVEHPAIENLEGEVYARVLTFERDNLVNFEINKVNDYKIAEVLHGVMLAAYIMDMKFDFAAENKKINDPKDEEWLLKLASFLGEDSNLFLFNRRIDPNWSWCKSLNSKMSIFSLKREAIDFLKLEVLQQKYDVVKGVNREIVRKNGYYNSISYSRLELGTDVLKLLEGRSNEKISYLILENGFFLFGEKHLIFLEDDCSKQCTNAELKIVKNDFNNLRSSLFPSIQFNWNERIEGGRFEELTRDLLIEEDNIVRVRLVSSGNDSDGGRDLEAEMYITNPIGVDGVEEKGPYRKIKVLVQCKAYKKSVNKGNVTDIRDTIEHFNAQGYFLVVSSNLTSSLYDHMNRMREGRIYWVDWWTKKEIEDKLADNLHIADKYKDIITYKLF